MISNSDTSYLTLLNSSKLLSLTEAKKKNNNNNNVVEIKNLFFFRYDCS